MLIQPSDGYGRSRPRPIGSSVRPTIVPPSPDVSQAASGGGIGKRQAPRTGPSNGLRAAGSGSGVGQVHYRSAPRLRLLQDLEDLSGDQLVVVEECVAQRFDEVTVVA